VALASAPDLLVLHAVRIQGMSDTDSVARRYRLARDAVDELLLDNEATGWLRRSGFADISGWSLTAAGRVRDNRNLADELAAAGVRDSVAAAHTSFVPMNTRLLELITKWQIKPVPGDPMARNDHTDWRWDEDILKSLAGLSRKLRPIGDQLADGLTRFSGYPDRLDVALARVARGERKYVDEPRIDSFHTIWFELHEDLLGTLGLERGDRV
jgi:hypothetical protein